MVVTRLKQQHQRVLAEQSAVLVADRVLNGLYETYPHGDVYRARRIIQEEVGLLTRHIHEERSFAHMWEDAYLRLADQLKEAEAKNARWSRLWETETNYLHNDDYSEEQADAYFSALAESIEYGDVL